MGSPSRPEPDEDRKILLALFNPQTEHADGCLFKTSGLCCQCGFSETVGHYRWALRRAAEIATEHYGKAFKANGPEDEDVGHTRADGWAIIECTGIDVRSVSPTRRAAIVNWLVTRKGLYVTTSWDDDRIDKAWDALRGEADAFEVTVRAKVSAPRCNEIPIVAAREQACREPFHWDDGVPYCDTCGLFRDTIARKEATK